MMIPRVISLALGVFAVAASAHAEPPPPARAEPPPGRPAAAALSPGERAVERYFAPVAAACSNGDDKACRRLAGRLHFPTNERELARLVGTLAKACGPKTPSACAAHATALAQGMGAPRDLAAAEKLLGKACRVDRVDFACSQLAELYLDGASFPGKHDEGERLARTSCTQLGGWPCTTVANLDASGDGVPSAAGLAFERRGCDGGDFMACYQLGLLMAEGAAGIAANPAQATALYARACDGDVPLACFNLAWQYARGSGATLDERRAHTLFERACRLGDASACDELARRDGKNRDYCDLWGAEACFALAEEITKQQGETAAAAEAIVYAAERACLRGHRGACNVLGHLARDSIRQCDGGADLANACMFAGVAYASGAGLASPDAAKARAAFTRACAAGAAPACTRAKQP